jgi:hypothetical protein
VVGCLKIKVIMNAKEKAQEIFNKIHDGAEMMYFKDCKNSALIAVDEIIEATSIIKVEQSHHRKEEREYSEFWKKVKHELENL